VHPMTLVFLTVQAHPELVARLASRLGRNQQTCLVMQALAGAEPRGLHSLILCCLRIDMGSMLCTLYWIMQGAGGMPELSAALLSLAAAVWQQSSSSSSKTAFVTATAGGPCCSIHLPHPHDGVFQHHQQQAAELGILDTKQLQLPLHLAPLLSLIRVNVCTS
jgi:hypothetical protein